NQPRNLLPEPGRQTGAGAARRNRNRDVATANNGRHDEVAQRGLVCGVDEGAGGVSILEYRLADRRTIGRGKYAVCTFAVSTFVGSPMQFYALRCGQKQDPRRHIWTDNNDGRSRPQQRLNFPFRNLTAANDKYSLAG